MKKILILLLIAFKVHSSFAAEKLINPADTIVAGSIEKNYPGGFESFNSFVKKKVRPPAIAFEKHKTGTSYISFIIESDGSTSHACTILAAGSGMDEETIRVVSLIKNWTPPLIDNKPVRAFCRLGVKFSADFNKMEMWVDAQQID